MIYQQTDEIIVKGNKAWDFSHPEGGASHLFLQTKNLWLRFPLQLKTLLHVTWAVCAKIFEHLHLTLDRQSQSWQHRSVFKSSFENVHGGDFEVLNQRLKCFSFDGMFICVQHHQVPEQRVLDACSK